MRVTKGSTYRHMSCHDADLHITAIKYLGPDYYVIKGVWVCRANGHLFFSEGAMKLYRKDLWKWSRVI